MRITKIRTETREVRETWILRRLAWNDDPEPPDTDTNKAVTSDDLTAAFNALSDEERKRVIPPADAARHMEELVLWCELDFRLRRYFATIAKDWDDAAGSLEREARASVTHHPSTEAKRSRAEAFGLAAASVRRGLDNFPSPPAIDSLPIIKERDEAIENASKLEAQLTEAIEDRAAARNIVREALRHPPGPGAITIATLAAEHIAGLEKNRDGALRRLDDLCDQWAEIAKTERVAASDLDGMINELWRLIRIRDSIESKRIIAMSEDEYARERKINTVDFRGVQDQPASVSDDDENCNAGPYGPHRFVADCAKLVGFTDDDAWDVEDVYQRVRARLSDREQDNRTPIRFEK